MINVAIFEAVERRRGQSDREKYESEGNICHAFVPPGELSITEQTLLKTGMKAIVTYRR